MSNLLKSKSEPKLKKQASSDEQQAKVTRQAQSKSEPKLKKQVSSDDQQAKINEVRELLGDLPTEMPGFFTDSTIRRFLRSRNWSTVQATKALKETVKWRRRYRPDKIRWEDVEEREQLAKNSYIADYLDKNGRTVLVMIMPSIKSSVPVKEMVKLLVYHLENCTMSSENAQDDMVFLVDYSGWTNIKYSKYQVLQ